MRGSEFGTELVAARQVARREMHRHDDAGAELARDAAGLARGQVVLAFGVRAVGVEEDALDDRS